MRGVIRSCTSVQWVFFSFLGKKSPQYSCSSCSSRSLVHGDDAAEALASQHVVKRLVDLGEGDPVGDERLHIQLLRQGFRKRSKPAEKSKSKVKGERERGVDLLHVHVDDGGEVGAGLVVAEEGPLEGPLGQKVYGLRHEDRLLVGDSHQHGHAPSLRVHASTSEVEADFLRKKKSCAEFLRSTASEQGNYAHRGRTRRPKPWR